ncbi:unnamed protein product [Effrenium voratum]|nr:unnamed protein product [Effrenium voratum]
MDVLISRGAQLEELDLLGRTPLIHATVFRAAEAVVWLAHKGAKLAHADQDGRTALHWAVRSSAPLTALLATVGAPLDVLDLEGCSPLGTAVELERLEVVEQLVLSGRADRVMREAALARLRPGPCSSWLRRCLEQQVGCHAALQEHCFLSCQAFPESRGCRGPEQIQAEPREFCWACAVLALGSAVFMLAKNDGSVREIDGPSQLLCAMVVPLTWAGALCFLAGARLPPGSVPATEARARRYKHVLQHAAAVKADDPDPGDFNWWGTKAQVVHELEMLGPERSKFCTATRQCVPMFDHYCAFLRNSVGPGNYAAFISCVCCAFIVCVALSISAIRLSWLHWMLEGLQHQHGSKRSTSHTLDACMSNGLVVVHGARAVVGAIALSLLASAFTPRLSFCRSTPLRLARGVACCCAEEEFPCSFEEFQQGPEELWQRWDEAVPEPELAAPLQQLPEALRWALLREQLRWVPREPARWSLGPWALALEVDASWGAASSTGLIRLAVSVLAEILARTGQPLERSELCALLWFLEFTLSGQASDWKQIAELRRSVEMAIQEEKGTLRTELEPGITGADLPLCVGDVLSVIHECCRALQLSCPWPADLGHLDALLFVNLVEAFDKKKSRWKPLGGLKAARAAQAVRQTIMALPLRQDTVRQRHRKLCSLSRQEREQLGELAWGLQDGEESGEYHESDESDDEDQDEFDELESDDDQDEYNESEDEGEEYIDSEKAPSDVRLRRQARVQWQPSKLGVSDTSDASDLLVRATMYMHHISAPWKQRWIRDVAKQAKLSGLCVFGKPGRILVEGPLSLVRSYTSQIKSWPWKRCDLAGPWPVTSRAFRRFRELKGSEEFRREVSNAKLSDELKGIRTAEPKKTEGLPLHNVH